MTIEESIRKRPAMYIGNDGTLGLLGMLVTNCIAFSRTDKISFEILLQGQNEFVLRTQSIHDLTKFWNSFDHGEQENPVSALRMVKALSSKFEYKRLEDGENQLDFSFDTEVLNEVVIDYMQLLESMLLVAMLNRNCKILTIDKRQHFLSQNYFHLPEGIFYFFERTVNAALGKPGVLVKYDGKLNDRYYQIGLAYRTDWFPHASVTSFANDVHTSLGGSLVDGIMDGIIAACKKYVRQKQLENLKVKRRKFTNGLILVCAVRGEEFSYGGSFKERLDNDSVRKDSKALVTKLVLEFFQGKTDVASGFLCRFDSAGIGSAMF